MVFLHLFVIFYTGLCLIKIIFHLHLRSNNISSKHSSCFQNISSQTKKRSQYFSIRLPILFIVFRSIHCITINFFLSCRDSITMSLTFKLLLFSAIFVTINSIGWLGFSLSLHKFLMFLGSTFWNNAFSWNVIT